MNKKPFLNDLQNLNWETNLSIAKKKKKMSVTISGNSLT